MIDILGLEGLALNYEIVARAEGEKESDGRGVRLKVKFPSMSKLVRKCGEGCRWGYVLR